MKLSSLHRLDLQRRFGSHLNDEELVVSAIEFLIREGFPAVDMIPGLKQKLARLKHYFEDLEGADVTISNIADELNDD